MSNQSLKDGFEARYRNNCDACGSVWISTEYSDFCEDCSPDKETEAGDPEYRGRKDEYTAYYGQEWPEVRQKVLERDGYRCQDCGMTNSEHTEREDLFGAGLHIHHIEPAKSFDTHAEANELSNLVPLCADCHRERENAQGGDDE